MEQNSKDWQHLVKNHVSSASKPLFVILGPTTSGKTGFSLKVAEFFKGEGIQAEIVNADSRQLYKYLDIGTAKITEEEKHGIPHHLFDQLDPNEPVTVSWYQKQATKVIDDILSRGNIPLLVGGSMLYIRSITDGLTLAPKVSEEFREKLEKEYDTDQGAALFKRLQELDQESAASIDPRNKRYLVRALEILEATAKPLSEIKISKGSSFDLLILGMLVPREVLHKKIKERTNELFQKGWIEEVKGLLAKGYTSNDPGLESTGYREILTFIDGKIASKKELIKKINAKTRQYARRQLTWWRMDERIYWIESSAYTISGCL